MTTLRLVNQALRKLDIDRNVELARSPAGYYYFLGTDSKVPSLPANDLSAYTTEEIIKHVIDNLNESNNMSNTVPTGYYQVKKTFKITYGGAWAITLKADRVLRYDEDTKRLESYNPDEKKWVNRKPPIQGTNNMNFSRYGFARDQREVVSTFINNTKKITKEEAEKIINAGTVSESKHRPIPTFENFEANEAKYTYKRGEPEFGKAPYPRKNLRDAFIAFDKELGSSSVNQKDREEIITKFMSDNDMSPSEEDMDSRLKAKGKDFEKKLTAKLDDLIYNGILMRRNAGMKTADIVSDLKARNYKDDNIDYSDYKG